MPLDATLPPARLPTDATPVQIRQHFPATFGVRVDAEGLEALPERERLRLVGARLPEPPEALLLDRVLQLVPVQLLTGVSRVLILPSRGVGRPGGFLNGIVSVSANATAVGQPDPDYGNRFSVFVTTVGHEVGHAIFQTALSPAQQDLVLDEYVMRLDTLAIVPRHEPTPQGIEHFFIDTLIPALLGFGSYGRGAADARRLLASFGVDLTGRGGER